MPPPETLRSLPEFVSKQVTDARRFFLNLNPSLDSPLEVVCGGVEKTRPEYIIDRDDFPYVAVEFVAEGEGTLRLGGVDYPLKPGSVFAYGPNTPHTIRSHAEHVMRKYYVDIVGKLAPKFLDETGLTSASNRYCALTVGRAHELVEVFELLLRNGHHGGPLVRPVCRSITQLLFLKIQELSFTQQQSMPQAYFTYERVRKWIDENFLRLQSARDIAKECDLTPVHLSRLFKRFSDQGAYQYLLHRKMNYAAGLLMNEGLMVKEVAEKMNFGDAFRFSRAFKRVYGVPPTLLTRASS